jgi:hypothetical protein
MLRDGSATTTASPSSGQGRGTKPRGQVCDGTGEMPGAFTGRQIVRSRHGGPPARSGGGRPPRREAVTPEGRLLGRFLNVALGSIPARWDAERHRYRTMGEVDRIYFGDIQQLWSCCRTCGKDLSSKTWSHLRAESVRRAR